MTAVDFTLTRPQATLRDQVVLKLRNAIVSGHFSPGQRLVERHMCELLGVSRTLVREALRQLEAEGWVRVLPYRGPVVATMTASEVLEFYEVRSALEGLAAQLCAERASTKQLKEMTRAVAALAACHKSGDLAGQRRQAGVFYELLREGAGNEFLKKQLTSLSSRLAWLRGVAFSVPERAGVSVREERDLVAALNKRDGRLAREICERNLHAAAETLSRVLEEAERNAS